MYLAKIEISNYRKISTTQDGPGLTLDLQPGLNILIGENDSGKTCVIDAIRLLTGTVTHDYFPITEEDFHQDTQGQATELTITGTFTGLNNPEAAALLEYLNTTGTGDETSFYLQLQLTATRTTGTTSPRQRRVTYELRAGTDDEGKRLDNRARDLLRATYLKPLRDAANELTARKGSRLATILRAQPTIKDQKETTWTADQDNPPETIVDIMRQAEHEIGRTTAITTAQKTINQEYLAPISIGETPLHGSIKTRAHDLRQILELMELRLDDNNNATRGLGTNNLLFIATELLALSPGTEPELPLLLIEEPEAHLEPQRQLQLARFLTDKAKNKPEDPQTHLQIVMTTHSSQLAATTPLAGLTIIQEGQAYPLAPEHTKLEQADYEFLERFLDVTKANLFFARGVLIVEGDAEALLLPTLAKKIGRPLTKHGVSIVNVGHIGLFRYARIFQRKQTPNLSTRVACIADRDLPPEAARNLIKEGRDTEADLTPEEINEHVNKLKTNDAELVTTYVSPCWTFEYDLAQTKLAPWVHAAITLAKKAKKPDKPLPTGEQAKKLFEQAKQEVSNWHQEGRSDTEIACQIYEPLVKKQASKPETAQALAHLLSHEKHAPEWTEEEWRKALPDYLRAAIDHATNKTEPAATDEVH